jgi:hypothetical protein
MSLPVFSSPRIRRRLLWMAGALTAGLGVVLTIALVPSPDPEPKVARGSAPAQVIRTPNEVPLTQVQRRMVTRLLDAFVPAAVERRDLAGAYRMVTPSFRAGVSRAEWNRGVVPIHPFDARNDRHFGWVLRSAFPGEISVDVLLQPSRREKLGALAFTAVFKRTSAGSWLIDEFVPAASFAPARKPPRILAAPDFQPNMVEGVTRSRLDAKWLLLPVAILALVPLVPFLLLLRSKRQERRALRAYRGLYERAL